MSVNLSIKNVPDELAERLRQQAKRNHRSLQGELLYLLEVSAVPHRISFKDFDQRMAKIELTTPGDSVDIIIRHDRDSH